MRTFLIFVLLNGGGIPKSSTVDEFLEGSESVLSH